MSKRKQQTDGDALDGSPGWLARRHLRFGWWTLLVFLSLGLVLELLHGLKMGWYLEPPNATRRLMWTLAHAHGTLMSLVHIAFAATIAALKSDDTRRRLAASSCLYGATLTLPTGFFLGGIWTYSGDPGLGILLVPLGGLLLLIAVFLIARGIAGEGEG